MILVSDLKTNFELYKIFYVAATEGNITTAAKKLYLTQPSVTKHIQNLEEELGCTLFVRSKRGVTLTNEGLLLFEHIAPACRMIFSAEKELRSIQSLATGTVSIVSTEMSFMYYVLPAMESFTQKYPGIKIRFSNALNENMERMLRGGKVDLAIMHEPFNLKGDMEITVIEDMEEYLVCGPKYKELSYHPRSPKELIEYPIISMPEGSSTLEYMSRFFQEEGLSFTPDITLTTVELTVRAIEGGLGIGMLPRRIAEQKIKDGTLYRIPTRQPLKNRKACLITNRHLPLSAAARAFLLELLDEKQKS